MSKTQSQTRKPINLKYIHHVTDFINLGHVTRSKVFKVSSSGKTQVVGTKDNYNEGSDQDTYMFLAMRGTGTVGGGGISVYKLSGEKGEKEEKEKNAENPELILHQDVAASQSENSLEGIDCETIHTIETTEKGTESKEKSILAAVANEVGVLHLYEIINDKEGKLTLGELGSLQLKVPKNPDNDQHAALHVEIYHNKDINKKDDEKRRASFALVSCTNSSWVVAVNITDPKNPKQVGHIETEIDCIEGIYLKPLEGDLYIDYAYCGGYRSSDFKVIELKQEGDGVYATLKMTIVNTLTAPYYNNMVSDTEQERGECTSNHQNYLFTVSWAHNRLMDGEIANAVYGSNLNGGGLIVFDVRDPSNPQELFPNAICPELSFSNRVKVTEDYAYIPLLMNPGRVGIVNIKDPTNIFFERSVVCRYTENPFSIADYNDGENEYLYVFGKNNTMTIMLVDFPKAA